MSECQPKGAKNEKKSAERGAASLADEIRPQVSAAHDRPEPGEKESNKEGEWQPKEEMMVKNGGPKTRPMATGYSSQEKRRRKIETGNETWFVAAFNINVLPVKVRTRNDLFSWKIFD